MLKQTKEQRPLNEILSLMPEMRGMKDVDANDDVRRLMGVIDSMTVAERHNPSKVIDQSRRRRIAAGAGVEPNEVSDLVKSFEPVASMMKRMGHP